MYCTLFLYLRAISPNVMASEIFSSGKSADPSVFKKYIHLFFGKRSGISVAGAPVSPLINSSGSPPVKKSSRMTTESLLASDFCNLSFLMCGHISLSLLVIHTRRLSTSTF